MSSTCPKCGCPLSAVQPFGGWHLITTLIGDMLLNGCPPAALDPVAPEPREESATDTPSRLWQHYLKLKSMEATGVCPDCGHALTAEGLHTYDDPLAGARVTTSICPEKYGVDVVDADENKMGSHLCALCGYTTSSRGDIRAHMAAHDVEFERTLTFDELADKGDLMAAVKKETGV